MGTSGKARHTKLMDKIRLTTKDDNYPIIYRVLYIVGGAGFRPSTVVQQVGWPRTAPTTEKPTTNKQESLGFF